MPIFYRGAGIGTYWHQRDARESGFVPQRPTANNEVHRIMSHVVNGTVISPYVSLTRSYAIARGYALAGYDTCATQPAFVYQIEIDENDHDGDASFLLGVVDPKGHEQQKTQSVVFPPPAGNTSRTPNLRIELEALVRALRDAEVLVYGAVSPQQVIRRIDVVERS